MSSARPTSGTASSSGCCPWSDREQLVRILAPMLDEDEFLSPYGLRALSRRAPRPAVHGRPRRAATFTVDYEPGESRSGLFGGNSNWRGPVWFPVNYLLIEALRRYAGFFGDDLLVEYPTGSGSKLTLAEVADDLAGRLVSLFPPDADGRRPVFGDDELFQTDPALARPGAVPRVLPRRHRRRASAPRTRPAGPPWSPT